MSDGEVLQRLKNLIDMHDGRMKTAIKKAISALDKQTPKKAKKIVRFSEYTFWECPSCTEPLVDLKRYCPECGQALE
jgi:Zn finger protein HypA/HybF involved in hydrogenase expression